ncbi:hypothetical protein [Salinispora fenicalii]|uniref:hypothetical protein n=1 Tax=Salinispora fenicalii TaxID=1137263 RepID=UPI0004834D89|nr:hypothetical protein [Salinispora fenicalii]
MDNPWISAEQLPDLAGVAVLLHYLNRVTNVYLHDMPPTVPELALPPVLGLLDLPKAATARRAHAPDVALGLLPVAEPPTDLSWAVGNEGVLQTVDPMVTERRRQAGVDDRTLLELSFWAAMAAARRVGSLLPMRG